MIMVGGSVLKCEGANVSSPNIRDCKMHKAENCRSRSIQEELVLVFGACLGIPGESPWTRGWPGDLFLLQDNEPRFVAVEAWTLFRHHL